MRTGSSRRLAFDGTCPNLVSMSLLIYDPNYLQLLNITVSFRWRPMAISWDILKARYLQANRAGQIDSLSVNLIRPQALADSGVDESVARHLIKESQFFIIGRFTVLA